MTPGPRLILASASPRRRQLLHEWGLPHEVRPSDVEEILDPDAPAASQALDLATRKAREVMRKTADPDAFVLGADTIVVHSGRSLGKPADPDEALAMLLSISGAGLLVVTGVALIGERGRREWNELECSILRMVAYDEEVARRYVATGEPMDKAGAFAIQGEGGRLVAELEGSWTNVVGLPRDAVLRLLRRAGFAVSDPAALAPDRRVL